MPYKDAKAYKIYEIKRQFNKIGFLALFFENFNEANFNQI